jgi:N-acyl-D-amino-acid deacylase
MWPFDRAFRALMDRWDIPGGALAVLEDGEIVLARGYGYADVGQGELIRPDSLFRIASVSKPVTAVAILRLVQEGKLDLDAPVFSLLAEIQPPEWASVDPRTYEITVRHLLEHSGGWDHGVSGDPMFKTAEIAREMESLDPADCPSVIGYMFGRALDFDPGSQWAYSNFGYCVLGRVLEETSGQTYEDFVRSEILEPIGLESMRLGRTRLADRRLGEVRYYDYEGAALVRSVFPEVSALVPMPYRGFHLEAMGAHGGWVASATDLARFVWALDTGSPATFLESETRTVMLARPEPPSWDGTSRYYGLGWQVRPAGKGSNWWRTGSMPGSSAVLYRTSAGLVWAALFNTRPDTSGHEFLVE